MGLDSRKKNMSIAEYTRERKPVKPFLSKKMWWDVMEYVPMPFQKTDVPVRLVEGCQGVRIIFETAAQRLFML